MATETHYSAASRPLAAQYAPKPPFSDHPKHPKHPASHQWEKTLANRHMPGELESTHESVMSGKESLGSKLLLMVGDLTAEMAEFDRRQGDIFEMLQKVLAFVDKQAKAAEELQAYVSAVEGGEAKQEHRRASP